MNPYSLPLSSRAWGSWDTWSAWVSMGRARSFCLWSLFADLAGSWFWMRIRKYCRRKSSRFKDNLKKKQKTFLRYRKRGTSISASTQEQQEEMQQQQQLVFKSLVNITTPPCNEITRESVKGPTFLNTIPPLAPLTHWGICITTKNGEHWCQITLTELNTKQSSKTWKISE